jgi:hypothetical protein
MKLEIFSTRLASQQHLHKDGNIQHEDGNIHHEAGIITTSTRSWKSLALGWHHNNINTKLEIFNTMLTSQQHQHEAVNIHHKAGITTTSTQSCKSSTLGWHQHYSPFRGRSFRTTPFLSRKCSNFT